MCKKKNSYSVAILVNFGFDAILKKHKELTMKKILILFLSICFASAAMAQSDSTKNKSKKRNVVFEFGLGAGAGLIRNSISPEFNATAKFVFDNKGSIRLNYTSYYSFQEDAQDKYRMYMNGFLNADFLGKGLSWKGADSMGWNGFGFGYLLNKSGNYFEGTTFKFYAIYELKHITISPEVIATRNFQVFFPGVTIGF